MRDIVSQLQTARQDRRTRALVAKTDGEWPGHSSQSGASPILLPGCRTLVRPHSGSSWPEMHVDLPFLAPPDTVDPGVHIVLDATSRHADEDPGAVPVGI